MTNKSIHEGKRYPCGKCDYKATERGSLRRHIGSVHEGERCPCGKCDYKATERGSLRQHIGSMHEGERVPGDGHFKVKTNGHIKTIRTHLLICRRTMCTIECCREAKKITINAIVTFFDFSKLDLIIIIKIYIRALYLQMSVGLLVN